MGLSGREPSLNVRIWRLQKGIRTFLGHFSTPIIALSGQSKSNYTDTMNNMQARLNKLCALAASRAISCSAWCRIFREISCFSPLNIGLMFRCCFLGQGTSPSNASLRWKWVPGRTEMAMCMLSSMRRNGWNDCMLSVELRWHTNKKVQWQGR